MQTYAESSITRINTIISTMTEAQKSDHCWWAAREHVAGSNPNVANLADGEIDSIIGDLADRAKTIAVNPRDLSATQLFDEDGADDVSGEAGATQNSAAIGYLLVEAAAYSLIDECDKKTESGKRRADLLAWLA